MGAAGAAHLANIYPDFPTLFNAAVSGRTQREIPVRITLGNQTDTSDIADGGSIIMQDGDAAEEGAIQLYLMSPALNRQDPGEDDGGDAEWEDLVYDDNRGLGEFERIETGTTAHAARDGAVRDRTMHMEQDITDANMAEDPDLVVVDSASEVASFHTASSRLLS